MLGLIPVYFPHSESMFPSKRLHMIYKFIINFFQQAKLGEVWNHMVIVQLHYCKDRFLDSPLHVCVTLAIVCLQKPEESIKMSLLWEKFLFQGDIFSSLNPFVMVLLASAVFCNSFNQFDSWACWPATILDFFPPISDHVTTKVKYIALSFSPSFPGPPELVDVTLVLVFLYSIGHRLEYNTNLFFCGFGWTYKHTRIWIQL